MAFPPAFLEDLRARLPLSEVVGKRIRLIRAGREYKSPCPFHNEKTPSFYVNDQKGFFHCFGCGAHGDIIGFTMRHDNLSFPEAIESLAGMAGLAVPRANIEEREKYEKRKTLHDLVEQACRWFENQLRLPAGRVGLEYLERRGLDGEAIARFRLGFAPGDSGALGRHLRAAGFSEEDMVAAGLLKRPEDGRAPYSFFRNRVLFPVTDRRGRVVAFGGRILEGDGPKYINSPDSALFQKGTLLYGLSRARQAAADGRPVIVAEGYMDVIALVKAGFDGAVAPLGTALTEIQILELWKLIPAAEKEPFLCFDGDAAGRRAAWRAVERILPHIGPGQSTRVAFLPEGEDPDSLIRTGGARAMQAVLDAALPLASALWLMETEGRRTDTPEAKAAVKAALEARVDQIADRTVQGFYRTEMRRRVDEAFAPQRAAGGGRAGWQPFPQGGFGRRFEPPRRHTPGVPGMRTSKRAGSPRAQVRPAHDRFERILLATLINHPALMEDYIEELIAHEFATPGFIDLQSCLREIAMQDMMLDADSVLELLIVRGLGDRVEELLAEGAYPLPSSARRTADDRDARATIEEMRGFMANRNILNDIRAVVEQFRRAESERAFRAIERLAQEVSVGAGEFHRSEMEGG